MERRGLKLSLMFHETTWTLFFQTSAAQRNFLSWRQCSLSVFPTLGYWESEMCLVAFRLVAFPILCYARSSFHQLAQCMFYIFLECYLMPSTWEGRDTEGNTYKAPCSQGAYSVIYSNWPLLKPPDSLEVLPQRILCFLKRWCFGAEKQTVIVWETVQFKVFKKWEASERVHERSELENLLQKGSTTSAREGQVWPLFPGRSWGPPWAT